MKHLFVINPKSFPEKRQMNEFIGSVSQTMGNKANVIISRYPRDAISKVNSFLKDANEHDEKVRVYAVGGDGILFDCLNGMLKYRHHELASIPYGNANDFLRSFGEENMQAFRDIKKMSEAPVIPTDIFRCGSNMAIANAAIGLESASIIETEKLAKKLSKISFLRKLIPALYIIGAVITLSNKNIRNQHYDITLDGVDYSGDYIDINIWNSFANGGKNIPNPYAMPNDGWLVAVFVKKMPFLKTLLKIGSFTSGNFEKHPDLFFHARFKELHAVSDQPIRICADGEAFFTSELNLKIYPGALNVAAPEGVTYRPIKEYTGVSDDR
jgi:diacylglycerol kinase family enzyme